MTTRDEIFETITTFKAENDGCPPTIEHLASHHHYSLATIRYHLVQMQLEGRLIKLPGRAGLIIIPGAVWLPPALVQALLHIELPDEVLAHIVAVLSPGP